MDIGGYFSEKIKNNGMTIKAVSSKAGIPYAHLQTSLKGRRDLRADEFIKLCICLNVDPNEFRSHART